MHSQSLIQESLLDGGTTAEGREVCTETLFLNFATDEKMLSWSQAVLLSALLGIVCTSTDSSGPKDPRF